MASIGNWTTKSFVLALSGDTVDIRIDDPTTEVVISVTNGTLSTTGSSRVDGVQLETVTVPATGIAVVAPTTVWGNSLRITSASADAQFTILKLF